MLSLDDQVVRHIEQWPGDISWVAQRPQERQALLKELRGPRILMLERGCTRQDDEEVSGPPGVALPSEEGERFLSQGEDVCRLTTMQGDSYLNSEDMDDPSLICKLLEQGESFAAELLCSYILALIRCEESRSRECFRPHRCLTLLGSY